MNQASYTIISLSPANLKAIMAIERAVFTDPWSERSVLDEFSNGRVYGIFINEKLAAFAVIRNVLDEAELLRIAVSKEYQRMGLAKGLMNYIEQEALNLKCHRLFLEVRSSNISAINLYLCVGFTHLCVRSCYYQNGEDAIIMQKLL